MKSVILVTGASTGIGRFARRIGIADLLAISAR